MPKRIVLPFVAVALVLVGCGGDDDDSTVSDNSPAQTTAQSTAPPVSLPGTVNDHGTRDASSAADVEVEQDNFYFNPTFIQVKGGQTLRIKLHNEGSAAHTFTSRLLNVDREVPPGGRAELSVTLPQTGPVAFSCRFHSGSGMQGAFFSQPGGTVGTTGGGSGGGGGGGY
jgi:plastocyanin